MTNAFSLDRPLHIPQENTPESVDLPTASGPVRKDDKQSNIRRRVERPPDPSVVSAVPLSKPASKLSEEPDTEFFSLARSVEEKDHSLGRHCERLALMSSVMGLLLGLPAEDILTLNRSGYLHDIGKVGLPDHILLKPAPLDAEEWEMMKTHPVYGEQLCQDVPSLEKVLPIIRHHHERWDGSGYPDGLKGEEIPLLARILQISDIYDALTSERPYKRAYSPREAISIIREETQKGWRDPKLLPVLEAALPLFESDWFWELSPVSLAGLAASVQGYEKSRARRTA